MRSLLLYVGAALGETGGCFAFWAWARLGASPLWLLPGIAVLGLFAFLLTKVDAAFAGRAFAAYGGVYIAASILWMWLAEGQRPDRWDLSGTALCLVGMGVILFAPRG